MTQKPKILITQRIHPKATEILRENGFEVDQLQNSLQKSISDYEGVITMLSDTIDASLLSHAKKLKVISNYAVGHNNIDLKEASTRGIAVCNTPDVLSDATAQLALALMLNVARQINVSAKKAINGHWKGWEPLGYLGPSLQNKNLGIIGLGRIGSLLAQKAKNAFGMNILYTGPSTKKDQEKKLNAQFLPFEELLKQSDFISIHCPLTNQSRQLFNHQAFSLMKGQAILINTARGEICDTDALLKALESKKIWGAGLDVTDPEPLPAAHPLYNLENVVITPHIGSATFEAREQMAIAAAQNIMAIFDKTKSFFSILNPQVL